jgi:hypothetical protein
MDIVLIIDGTHTLLNIINFNWIYANLVSQVFFRKVSATITTEAKVVSYQN